MKKTILIVDDDPDIRQLAKMILVDHFTVHTAPDGASALSIFAQHDINLVLLDVMMPGKSGLEVSKSLRQIKHCPIIFFSAKDTREDIIAGLEYGVDYITKPFEPEELIYRVKAQLNVSIKEGMYHG